MKSTRTARVDLFPLPDIGAVDGVTVGCHVVDPEGSEIAPAQLAVDCEVEQCQVARGALQLQLRSD